MTGKITITCSQLAVAAQCSAMYARKAVQIVCRELYGHEYYLTAEEQMEKEPQEVNEETSVHHLPHSIEEWRGFRYVLPSKKTIGILVS